MKLLQVTLVFTFMMLAANVAASSNRRDENTDNTEEFQLEIPEDCKELGFCEDIPNYPKEQAAKVISELSDPDMYQDDKVDSPDSTRRIGPVEENVELCEFDTKVVYPKAATDRSGTWHVVLNNEDAPVQAFKVDICKNKKKHESSSESEVKPVSNELCSGVAVFVSGYEGRCKQKFMYRKMAVLLDDGTKVHRSLKLPSCCSCVGTLTS